MDVDEVLERDDGFHAIPLGLPGRPARWAATHMFQVVLRWESVSRASPLVSIPSPSYLNMRTPCVWT